MVHAFVLVKADVGRAAELASAISGITGVRDANVVAGDWDLVVEVEGEEVYDVLDTTAAELQGLSGVVNTKTYVALEG